MAGWIELLKGTVDDALLQRASQARRDGQDPTDILLESVSASAVLRAQARFYEHPYVELELYRPENEAVALVSEQIARKFSVLPLFKDDKSLYVATANPGDLATLDFLQKLTGLTVEVVLATRADIEAALNRWFLTHEQSARAMSRFEAGPAKSAPAATASQEVRVEDADAPAIKIVNYILGQAVNLGASDIHLEAFASRICLRYRIDGVLHEYPAPPEALYRALVSRVKILANLDVAERRAAQDGRARFELNEREYDLRVSVVPNLAGEGFVIRVLDAQGSVKTLADLGFEPAMLAQYEQLIRQPHGIILVTGPTGAGKSTTLYATLQAILTPRKKIVTLEDPPEYVVDGITQVALQPAIGFNFAAALRAILRHDPDVVMLGEIRDAESAEIAIRASMTGHLVFSTLHTNDAPSAVTRLLDIGVAPYLVLSSLSCVLAQRLLRRLCPACKVEGRLTDSQKAALHVDGDPPIYLPQGCTTCNRLGYKGRLAIYELLEISPPLRALTSGSLTVEQVRNTARHVSEETGGDVAYVTLRTSALQKLLEGIVSAEDVLDVTIQARSESR